ncbi:MAG: hypothetical protein BRD55_02030 [Bacteroidetes bacterium SW_9_63_38]|nr:MAG: hypothetical protein BRD55_02030 [Bacteroidetes bacterium SW_9_63_38]
MSVLEEGENEYQSILIDCARSTSILSVNALIAADAFMIPVTPSYRALEGVLSLGEVVRRVRRGIGKAVSSLGLALTMVDRSEPPVDDAIEQPRNHYGRKAFDTEIRTDSKLEEAPSRTKDVSRHAPNSQGTQDYRDLIDEIEERLQRYGSVYRSLQDGGTLVFRLRRDGRASGPDGEKYLIRIPGLEARMCRSRYEREEA